MRRALKPQGWSRGRGDHHQAVVCKWVEALQWHCKAKGACPGTPPQNNWITLCCFQKLHFSQDMPSLNCLSITLPRTVSHNGPFHTVRAKLPIVQTHYVVRPLSQNVIVHLWPRSPILTSTDHWNNIFSSWELGKENALPWPFDLAPGTAAVDSVVGKKNSQNALVTEKACVCFHKELLVDWSRRKTDSGSVSGCWSSDA